MSLPCRPVDIAFLVVFLFFQYQTVQAQVTAPAASPSSTPSSATASQSTSAASAVLATKPSSAAAASSATPTSLAASVPQALEQPIVDLAKALTKLAEKRAEPEKITTTIFGLLGKLGALVGTLIAAYGSYKASKKIPWFKENREFVATVVTSVSVVVLFYLLSGIITSVLYVVIAVLVLLIALALAGAHLLQFIDEKYPDVRDSILHSFAESTTSKSTRKLVRDNTRNVCDWLSNIVLVQSLNGDYELVLIGSFVEGFDASTFQLHPAERTTAHWQIIDDRMLVPVGTTLRLKNAVNGNEAEVVNIQMGMVVVRVGEGLCFQRFDADGFKILGAALLQHQAGKMKAILERQKEIAANSTLFNSQSF